MARAACSASTFVGEPPEHAGDPDPYDLSLGGQRLELVSFILREQPPSAELAEVAVSAPGLHKDELRACEAVAEHHGLEGPVLPSGEVRCEDHGQVVDGRPEAAKHRAPDLPPAAHSRGDVEGQGEGDER